jgi:hypothetical protein
VPPFFTGTNRRAYLLSEYAIGEEIEKELGKKKKE